MMQGKVQVMQCILVDVGVGKGTASTGRVWVHVALRVGNCMTPGVGQREGERREGIPAAGSSSRRPLMAWVSSNSCWLPASPIFRHLYSSSKQLPTVLYVFRLFPGFPTSLVIIDFVFS